VRSSASEPGPRLAVLRRYLLAVAALNLVWEIVQLPLYTLWREGSAWEVAFAVAHCTGGDVLIATSSLVLALLLFGEHDWPTRGFGRVAAAAILFGAGYTVFSEWLNVEIRGSWGYADSMPTVPVLGTGLAPLAQWVIVPLTAFRWAHRNTIPYTKDKAIMTKVLPRRAALGAAIVLPIGAVAISVLHPQAEEAVAVGELAAHTHFHGLAVDRADPSRLYLATHHGLFVVDGRGMATRVSEARDDYMGFTPHPTDPATLYASGHPAGGGNLGVLLSEDGGRSWRRLAPGVDGPVDFHQLDVSAADPQLLYGAFAGQLQVSRDGGRSWALVGPAPEGLIDLAASAKDADMLYAATQQGLLRSADGGRSWEQAYWLRRPATMVQVTPEGSVWAFLVGTGLIRADEPDLAWTTLKAELGEAVLLHLAAAPDRLYAVSYDPRSKAQALLTSGDGGRSWSPLGVGAATESR
jgi:photosystem II stability/assembly factor-like uncharacterized protein